MVQTADVATRTKNKGSITTRRDYLMDETKEVVTEQQIVEAVQGNKEDPVAPMDPSRTTRLDALAKAENVLGRAARGANLDKKEVIHLTKQLFVLCASHEGVIQALIADLVQIVQGFETVNVGQVQFSVALAAIRDALITKGVLTDEELKESWGKIVKEAMKSDDKEREVPQSEEESKSPDQTL